MLERAAQAAVVAALQRGASAVAAPPGVAAAPFGFAAAPPGFSLPHAHGFTRAGPFTSAAHAAAHPVQLQQLPVLNLDGALALAMSLLPEVVEATWRIRIWSLNNEE